MKSLFVVLLLILLPNLLFPQVTLQGKLTDSVSQLPVQYATIYVNGTMKGTISDTSGFFILNNLPLPCEVVVSHINYLTLTINYTRFAAENLSLNLELTPRQQNIQEVTVSDINRREKNLAYFQKTFLGENKWGDYAFIENDSVLFFSAKFREDLERENMKHPEYPDSFRAISSAPLIIELPLLGYKLYANLEYFTVNYLDSIDQYQTHCIGYSYFIPQHVDSNYKFKKITDHRKEVYYNSRLHLFRSINQGQLKENGYIFAVKGGNDIYDGKQFYTEVQLDTAFHRSNEGTVVIGLKDQVYYVIYYHNFKGEPANISKRLPARPPIVSSIYFSKDTCQILNNGRVADQSIIFGPAIGDKKLGTWLPDDYYPTGNKKKHVNSTE